MKYKYGVNMGRASPHWKKKEIERIKLLDNNHLLGESLEMAGGDDYDGCFTRNGWITYCVLIEELGFRLKDWLNVENSKS